MNKFLQYLAEGLAVGFFFVWVFGFAIGYHDPITPALLFALAVGSFTYARILAKKNDTLD